MKSKLIFTLSALVWALMAADGVTTRSQTNTTANQPAAKKGRAAQAFSITGTAGRLAKFAGDGSAVVNSNVTETKSGNIGIGTTTPTSLLTVQGMIETTLGGYKFPDGTIQTTAFSGIIVNQTLFGNGTASSPLAVAVPLNLVGAVPRFGVINAANREPGGRGIEAIGGDASSITIGGTGLFAQGGGGTENTGGDGLFSAGGIGADHNGGAGGKVFGGSAGNGSGGDGLIVSAGAGLGAGHKGGNGLVAFAGRGAEGATTGLAGEFHGDVSISGNLSKGGGSFKIDHPLDPENKYLYHSFVESPDMKNIYDGNVTTDVNGDAVVDLPEYFEALNRDFRYQLTVIGTFAQAIIAEKINGNHFRIKTNAPHVEVSWQVTGVRQDAYANKNRIPVEVVKSEKERGFYLHPDAFNQPADKGVQSIHLAPVIQRTSSIHEKVRVQSQKQ